MSYSRNRVFPLPAALESLSLPWWSLPAPSGLIEPPLPPTQCQCCPVWSIRGQAVGWRHIHSLTSGSHSQLEWTVNTLGRQDSITSLCLSLSCLRWPDNESTTVSESVYVFMWPQVCAFLPLISCVLCRQWAGTLRGQSRDGAACWDGVITASSRTVMTSFSPVCCSNMLPVFIRAFCLGNNFDLEHVYKKRSVS